MERRSGKRLRNTRTFEPRKRRRAQVGVGKVVKAGQRVDANDLKWREIEIPEGFEDAEGFLGLEEIDDVAIHHRPDDGTVEFLQGTKCNLDP